MIQLRDDFLRGMSHAAATVNIIATDGPAGRARVTVSAMASVSADTPQPTLMPLRHLSPETQKIMMNGSFVVNALRCDQSCIADTFAGRFKDQISDKFDCTDWATLQTDSPRVVDPLVAFDCRVVTAEQVVTHHVFYGKVKDVFTGANDLPLIYPPRAHGSPSRIDAPASNFAGRASTDKWLSLGCFHTLFPRLLPEILARVIAEVPGIEITLIEGDQSRVQESLRAGEVEAALLYDLNLPDDLAKTPLFYLHPYVLLPADHPLAARTQIDAADLAKLPMVLLNAPPSNDYFPDLLRAAGVEANIVFRSAAFETVRGLAGLGLGYALLATKPSAVQTYDGRPLFTRPLSGNACPSRVVLATRKGAPLSAAAERLVWLCRDHFATDG
jgi:DNA-binding transcriptional LysR family regulator/flavin reductase (DIM6/NTAB) family NADH-FMN oxidoreductase RutF